MLVGTNMHIMHGKFDQLSEPEIEYDIIEKCMWQCSCANVQMCKKNTILGKDE